MRRDRVAKQSTMKKTLFFLLVLSAFSTSRADFSLVVHRKSGGQVEYAFREQPIVTYEGDYLIISSGLIDLEGTGGASVWFPLDDVRKLTIGETTENATRITAPKNEKAHPTLIYTLDGKLVRTLQPSDDGTTPASLDGLPAGTYVIKNGSLTYKAAKK